MNRLEFLLKLNTCLIKYLNPGFTPNVQDIVNACIPSGYRRVFIVLVVPDVPVMLKKNRDRIGTQRDI